MRLGSFGMLFEMCSLSTKFLQMKCHNISCIIIDYYPGFWLDIFDYWRSKENIYITLLNTWLDILFRSAEI